MKPIIISLIYEALIWIAYAIMPHWIWSQPTESDSDILYIIYGVVVAVIQIIVYLLLDIVMPMREKNNYNKHFWSFIISHIVFTLIIWLIIRGYYHKELGPNPNYDIPFGQLNRLVDFFGGEEGVCALIFSNISMDVSVGLGLLLNRIFRRSKD